MINLLKIVNLPWEKARGYLRLDLQTIESAVNQRWAATFGNGNKLGTANGGTGSTSLPAHTVLLGEGTSPIGATAVGASNTVLHGNTGADPTYSPVDLTADVANVLPEVNGGTGTSVQFSLGSVVFQDMFANYTQDNANFSYDPIGHNLSLGANPILGASTAHGVLIGKGAFAPIVTTAAGATNTLLHGNTGADPTYSAVVEADITLADNTTDNVSTTKHGFAPKSPNDATKFLDGTGAYSTPSGPGTSTITTTGGVPALAIPAGSGNLIIFCNNATLLQIQGITAGSDGQRLTIYSIGAGQIDLFHQSGSATAANRLINFATSGNTSLAAGVGAATFIYDATASRWRLDTHEQGAYITPTCNAGNFTATGGTWTVAAGNVSTYAYYLNGRSLFIEFYITATTVGSTPSALHIAIPGGYTAAKFNLGVSGLCNDNNAANSAMEVVSNAGTVLDLYSTITAGGWHASTSLTNVFGNITLDVT